MAGVGSRSRVGGTGEGGAGGGGQRLRGTVGGERARPHGFGVEKRKGDTERDR